MLDLDPIPPRATLVVLMAVAGSFQIPAAAVPMLLGVDTIMDMGRTGLNVVGNCMAAVARWEGELEVVAISVLTDTDVGSAPLTKS